MLVIDATDKSWELRSKIDCLVDLQPIAKRVENRAEEPEALSAISPAYHVIELVDPLMREVDGVIKRLEPMRGHRQLP
jgi:hypothetical protein